MAHHKGISGTHAVITTQPQPLFGQNGQNYYLFKVLQVNWLLKFDCKKDEGAWAPE